MKRFLISAAAAIVAMGCSESTTDTDFTTTDETAQAVELLINVSSNETSDEPSSRVALAEDEDGNLTTTWKSDDRLAAWVVESENTNYAAFYIDEFDETNSDNATFKGTIYKGDALRLIHPYNINTYSLDPKLILVNLSAQSVDMSNDGLSQMSDYTYMVSDEISIVETSAVPSTTMRHVGAALKVGLRFSNLPVEDLTIQSITLGRGCIPNDAAFNLYKDVMDDDFLAFSLSTSIKATITNSPTIEAYDAADADNTTYYICLNTLPFTIEANANIVMDITLASADGAPYAATYTITNGETAKEIGRATYTSLNYSCDMEGVESNYWESKAATEFAGGDGTEDYPYQISTPEQLAKLINDVNTNSTYYSGEYLLLTNDIDLSGSGWTPIGTSSTLSFQGTLDGGGYEVMGLYVNASTSELQGLFGRIKNCTIKNLGVSGSVSGYRHVGGIVGYAYNATISNCYNNATVTCSDQRVGGVAGYAGSCKITSCYNSGDVTSPNNTNGIGIGGIIGFDDGTSTVVSCYNSGDVTGVGYRIGGIVGHFNGGSATVKYCYNSGAVTRTIGSGYVAGLVGNTLGSTLECSYSLTGSSANLYCTSSDAPTIIEPVEEMSLEEMTDGTLLDLLNGYVTEYNATDPETPASPWVAGDDGFPTIDMTVE